VVHRAEIPEWHFGCKFHPKVLISFALRLRVGVQHDRDAEAFPLRKDDIHGLAHKPCSWYGSVTQTLPT